MKTTKAFAGRVVKYGTVFVVNCAVLLLLAVGFGREYLRNIEIEHSIRQLEEQREELESDKLESLAVIQMLSSEYYLEREARQKHNLARPGEEVIIVREDDGTAEGDDVMATVTVSNAKRWFLYFFDPATFAELRQL